MAAPQYQIFDIGVIQAGDTASQGFGVSAGGVAVGRSVRSGGSQAFRWNQAAGLIGLPNLSGRNFAVSNDANDNGIVVGTAATTLFGSSRLPVIWNNGVVSQLPLPAGETLGDANGVNASGIAVGSVDGGSLQQAVIYNGANATVITQTTPTGCFFLTAFGINDSGRIVGTGIDPNNAARNVGMVYDMGSGAAFEVGALPNANGALAFAVSNNGHVVGSSMMNQGSGLPFIYSDGAGMRAIPLAAGTTQGSARGVNSAGWVVGQDSSAFSIPFLWDGGTTYRLADLLPAGSGWDLDMNTSSSALGISDNGVIIGTGVHNGEVHAYAMVPAQASPTPTPPPPTTDYAIAMTDSPDPVQVGQNLTYSITVSNLGPMFGVNVTMTDTLPAGVQYVSATPSQGSCTGTSTVTCNLGIFQTSATITLVVTPTVAGQLSNTANVVYSSDPNPNNNSSTAMTTVIPAATPTATPTPSPTATPFPTPTPGPETDIVVFNMDSPDPVQVGQNLTYTITVINAGAYGPVPVQMIDNLPASVNFVSVTSSQGSCTGTSQIICNLGDLGTATVTLVVTPTQAGQLSNIAEAQTNAAHDPMPGNNYGMASTTVLPSGSPTPTPTATATVAPTPTPSPTPAPPAKARNLSTRMRVQAGDNVGIGGFIINGNASKNVAIRGLGPSLGAFGIADALADPTLELRDSNGGLLRQNDDWHSNPAEGAYLTLLGLAPSNSKESGMVVALQPGASYTAILAGKNQTTGVGLVEIYDVDETANSQLANISTRSFVLNGNDVTIAGFILGGNNNTRIVVRGLGPSLVQFGLSPVLADPTLELRDSNGTLLIANNDWQDDPTMTMPGQLVALGLAPQNMKESAVVVSLPPGAFTAILAGKNGGTGIGLVEIYNVQ